jgi:uncharacterized oxidoreductase
MELRGARTLITGGASGIGAALAAEFVASGAVVCVCDRDAAGLESLGAALPAVRTFRADISSAPQIEELIRWCKAELGGLDVLVQNAGVAYWYDIASTADVAMLIQDEVGTNFTGPLLVATAFLPLLADGTGGTLCIVSSGLAYVPLHCYPVYSATKAALHSFTRSLRAKAPRTVRVVEILPPFVDTALVRDIAAMKISARATARAIRGAIERNRTEVAIGVASMLPILLRIAPHLTERVLQRLAWRKGQ